MIRYLIQRIKLFSSKRKEFYAFINDTLGFYPTNTNLFDIAFAHRSASMIDSLGNPINNERLEYLGDAILGAVVAEFLYNRFPQRGEGFLTQMRSKLVNRVILSDLMKEMGLDRFVKARTIGSMANSSIYGDAFEALIGAIYLDQGFEKTRKIIIKRILKAYLDLNKIEEVDNNFKSQLIEWGQKNKLEIIFNTTEEEKPRNKNNAFHTSIEIDSVVKGVGFGISKKESQQNAAREAIINLELEMNTSEHTGILTY